MTSREAGHSLIEMSVVVVVLSIVAAAAVPSYRRADAQARVDACAASLRSVWSAQRTHWLETRGYAATFETLRDEGSLDAAAFAATDAFAFRMIAASANSFEARAVRTAGAYAGTLTVDETGEVRGSVSGAGGDRVEPSAH
jgi:type IV pilus assembly protein PilE